MTPLGHNTYYEGRHNDYTLTVSEILLVRLAAGITASILTPPAAKGIVALDTTPTVKYTVVCIDRAMVCI